MKRITGCLLAVIFAMAGSAAYADTLRLRNGTKVEGVLIGSDSREVRFLGPDGSTKPYPINSISAIEFGGTPPAGVAPRSTAAPAPAAAPTGVTVPDGTEIVVRLIDGIDSTKTAAGERFRASIDDPVVVGNQVVIPRGADCTVQIVQNKDSKELSIKLYDVTINGRPHDAVTEYAQVKAPGKGKKYARRGVGLGALGAGIGAIAGGGKGAAIGAAVGGGVGVASAAASSSKIQLPSETRLTFKLRAPLPVN